MHTKVNSKRGGTASGTNQSLLRRIRNWQDRRSWNEFYRQYHKLVFAVARQSGLSDSEAWDAVQETFVTIAKQSQKGAAYDPSLGSFQSWLLNVTRWRIRDLQRSRHKNVEEAMPGGDMPDANGETFEELWEREWQQNLTREAVARVRLKVSPRQFQIFDYHVLQGMPAADVCRKLGVNSAQVYLAKHRVGLQLRHEIAELRREEE